MAWRASADRLPDRTDKIIERAPTFRISSSLTRTHSSLTQWLVGICLRWKVANASPCTWCLLFFLFLFLSYFFRAARTNMNKTTFLINFDKNHAHSDVARASRAINGRTTCASIRKHNIHCSTLVYITIMTVVPHYIVSTAPPHTQ